jgi:hypothetical protein
MALCRTTVVSKGVIRGELVCFKKSHKERLFLYQHRVVFKLRTLSHTQNKNQFQNGLHILKKKEDYKKKFIC